MSGPEKNEKELNRAYQVGISIGWEQASSFLFDEATKAFQLRNDPFATLLRKYADIAKKRSQKEHPGVPEKKSA